VSALIQQRPPDFNLFASMATEGATQNNDTRVETHRAKA